MKMCEYLGNTIGGNQSYIISYFGRMSSIYRLMSLYL